MFCPYSANAPSGAVVWQPAHVASAAVMSRANNSLSCPAAAFPSSRI
jgi:hypothetical protein